MTGRDWCVGDDATTTTMTPPKTFFDLASTRARIRRAPADQKKRFLSTAPPPPKLDQIGAQAQAMHTLVYFWSSSTRLPARIGRKHCKEMKNEESQSRSRGEGGMVAVAGGGLSFRRRPAPGGVGVVEQPQKSRSRGALSLSKTSPLLSLSCMPPLTSLFWIQSRRPTFRHTIQNPSTERDPLQQPQHLLK